MMNIHDFFNALWQDYIQMAPSAVQIQQLFSVTPEENIVNDHVAFRTLNLAPIHLESLEQHLLHWGYQRFAPYEFPEKKLKAWGYVPPEETLPRIFLSELICEAFSDRVQAILQELCNPINPKRVESPDIFWAGRLWQPITWEDYQTLAQESEYAAWVAALGLRPNHFTLSVNHLQFVRSLQEVVEIVEQQGIPLNTAGGKVKGSPEVLLEQVSTLGDRMAVEFAGGELHTIPTCYYEFARRYPTPEGTLYQGFVAQSADRIFESTNLNQ
ncbi:MULTISPECIES: DUF1338 domain-containing protein [Desertifilum]|uniref:DUF1338 domain-containing protein n=2 Tax=Desertifilum tharense IPPAS B-1220 TaxID=1781255 RepID=A0ACD5GS19_9CYAN|nr:MULTISPECIES: DUF1338 domain-containing protein [Desertifilum]MDA0210243.1 DUF1338 domain-containing protein [Cyanobacteria bacterium FC1]